MEIRINFYIQKNSYRFLYGNDDVLMKSIQLEHSRIEGFYVKYNTAGEPYVHTDDLRLSKESLTGLLKLGINTSVHIESGIQDLDDSYDSTNGSWVDIYFHPESTYQEWLESIDLNLIMNLRKELDIHFWIQKSPNSVSYGYQDVWKKSIQVECSHIEGFYVKHNKYGDPYIYTDDLARSEASLRTFLGLDQNANVFIVYDLEKSNESYRPITGSWVDVFFHPESAYKEWLNVNDQNFF